MTTSTEVPISSAARWFILLAAILVATAGASLFFLSEETALYFAWTINPPVTASYLGTEYLSVATALALALREHEWARVRIGVWVVATGLISILIATLLHMDKFHLDNPVMSAKGWAWSWLILYIVLVPGLMATLWAQRREKGRETPPAANLPSGFRLGLRLFGTLLAVTGIALYIAPGTAEYLWPWKLTPLTARMVGSFYIAIAVSSFVAAKENDYTRIHVACFAYLLGATLQLVTMARYPVVDWQSIPGAMLAIVIFSMFVIAVIGIRGYVVNRSESAG